MGKDSLRQRFLYNPQAGVPHRGLDPQSLTLWEYCFCEDVYYSLKKRSEGVSFRVRDSGSSPAMRVLGEGWSVRVVG